MYIYCCIANYNYTDHKLVLTIFFDPTINYLTIDTLDLWHVFSVKV